MRGEDHFRASLGQIFNRRDGPPEPVILSDLPVADGHVEVHPDEDTSLPIAIIGQIGNDLFHHSAILSDVYDAADRPVYHRCDTFSIVVLKTSSELTEMLSMP